jgi:uncharacterized coiled-coil DUF342 family protein
MIRFRSISKQIMALHNQIREKYREIAELENRVSLLQQSCEHRSKSEAEDVNGKGWMSCDECGTNLYQLY